MKRLLPIFLFCISSGALAESGAYRVEVIVFQNLAAVVAADVVLSNDELRSFSQFPALEESNLPDDLMVVSEKSARMTQVWRRLRSSKAYRPLLYTGWEQNRIDYYPALHIHNKEIIATRLQELSDALDGGLIRYQLPLREQPLAENLFQIDGSVQLRRSRFLHLDIDLEYRIHNNLIALSGAGGQAANQIFILQQSRQVRRAQLQYFDSPYFGALVLVSAVAPK